MISSACDLFVRASNILCQFAQASGGDAPPAVDSAADSASLALAGLLLLVLLAIGLTAWGIVVARWRRGEPAIAPVPRRVVPWHGFEVCAIIGLLLAGTLLGQHASRPDEDPIVPESAPVSTEEAPQHAGETPPKPQGKQSAATDSGADDATSADDADKLTPDQIVRRLADNAAVSLVLAGGIIALLVFVRRANARDLGFAPFDPVDFVRATLTWAAVLVPVYVLQNVLVMLIDRRDRQENPLIEMVGKNHDSRVLLVAGLTAVVVAPLVEELLFRVVLQGWLERLFAPRDIAETAATDPTCAIDAEIVAEQTTTLDGNADARDTFQSKLIPVVASPVAAAQIEGQSEHPSAPHHATPVDAPPEPLPAIAEYFGPYASPHAPLTPRRLDVALPGMPPQFPDWRAIVPIVASSVLFAAAHVGVWPDPVPLFVLALALGYVYHQTHRIWPSVLVHMLFNFFSIAVTWAIAT
jgi:membrane protease YdiL (CAAX protease family)